MRKIGLLTAVFMVCANVIGTGIFTSLGFQVVHFKSAGEILLLWVVGGLVALSGALTYSELALRMPRSGGEFVYLSQIFGRPIGFIAGWISLAAGFAAPIAAAAIALSKYLSGSLALPSEYMLVFNFVIAVVAVTALSRLHLSELNRITKFQNFFVVLKIALILFLAIFGFFVSSPQSGAMQFHATTWSSMLKPEFGVSLVFVLYAYSGWNAATYITEELRDPERNVPKALLFGTLIVMTLYCLLNLAFLNSTPISDMAGRPDVAFVVTQNLFGPASAQWLGLLISIALLSSMSAMIWAGGRVGEAIGREFSTFGFLSGVNAQGRPKSAIGFIWLLIVLMLATASFESVIEYIGFSLSLCSFLTVGGLFILRSRPNDYKGFKAPLWAPICFLCVVGGTLIYLIMHNPVQILINLGSLGIVGLVYWLDQFRRRDEGREVIKKLKLRYTSFLGL